MGKLSFFKRWFKPRELRDGNPERTEETSFTPPAPSTRQPSLRMASDLLTCL